MVTFKTWIFNLLPSRFYREDTYKDVNGEGIFQRYTQAIGEELDEELVPYLTDYLLNQVAWDLKGEQAPYEFLVHLSDCLGNPPDIFLGEVPVDEISRKYRKLLRYIASVYKIKGTRLSYELFFGLLGYNVNIIEIPQNSMLYDEGLVYDTIDVYYDEGCSTCSGYSLAFTDIRNDNNTIYPISADTLGKLQSIVKFLEPINAVLANLSNNVALVEEQGVCMEEDILVWRLEPYIYDDGHLTDDGMFFDDSNPINLWTGYFDCQGNQTNAGIGYWAIENDFEVN